MASVARTFLPVPALVAAFITVVAPAGLSQDWYVDVADPNCPSGDGSAARPFCDIQTAINAAASGDAIHVASGTYFENLLIDKHLTLIGTSGKELTVVDGSDLGTVVKLADALTVELRGLTLTNGSGGYYPGAIWAGIAATLTLTESEVSSNESFYVGGIHGSGTLTLSNSTIQGNRGETAL